MENGGPKEEKTSEKENETQSTIEDPRVSWFHFFSLFLFRPTMTAESFPSFRPTERLIERLCAIIRCRSTCRSKSKRNHRCHYFLDVRIHEPNDGCDLWIGLMPSHRLMSAQLSRKSSHRQQEREKKKRKFQFSAENYKRIFRFFFFSSSCLWRLRRIERVHSVCADARDRASNS